MVLLHGDIAVLCRDQRERAVTYDQRSQDVLDDRVCLRLERMAQHGAQRVAVFNEQDGIGGASRRGRRRGLG